MLLPTPLDDWACVEFTICCQIECDALGSRDEWVLLELFYQNLAGGGLLLWRYLLPAASDNLPYLLTVLHGGTPVMPLQVVALEP